MFFCSTLLGMKFARKYHTLYALDISSSQGQGQGDGRLFSSWGHFMAWWEEGAGDSLSPNQSRNQNQVSGPHSLKII